MSTIRTYTKDLFAKFKEDDVPLLAAAQAYYYFLSLFPLLIVCFTIVPYLQLDPTDVVNFLEQVLPSGLATILEDNIVSLIETPQGGLLTVGIIGTLWSTSNGINAFIKATNETYEVEETRSFITVRVIAFALTIGMIISIICAILLPIFGSVILDFLTNFFGISGSLTVLLQVIRWVATILVISIVLLFLYRLAPNKKLPLKHIIPGALISSILWISISLAFSFYVSNFGNYTATYGSLGGIIILMIWFYLTGIILMVGAEINVVYHRNQNE